MTDKLVEAKIIEILSNGKSFEYILGCWQHRHFGAVRVGKALLITVPSGSMLNSQGTHVQVCGPPGSGKSNAVQEMAALIPPKWMKSSALTPQAIFYPIESFLDSSIVFQDDIVWGNTLGVSIKRVTSAFQTGAERTVTTDSVGVTQKSRSRLVWWVTSVDNQADEQVRDRFILVETDGSKEQLDRSMQLMQQRDAGNSIKYVDQQFEMEVCHGLIGHIRNLPPVEVIVPFAEKIEFEGELRAYKIFIDMVKAFAVFDRDHRMESNGRLEATKEDFDRALSLYTELEGHSPTKYTKTELKFFNTLVNNGHELTRQEMQKASKMSMGQIGDLLNGRNKEEQQGLLHKCPELSISSDRPYKICLDKAWSPNSHVNIRLKT